MRSSLQNEETLSVLDTSVNPGVPAPRVSILDRVTPGFVRAARATYREGGMRAVWKRYGWKLFAAFFLYYLIRDSFLYIILPLLIARGLFS